MTTKLKIPKLRFSEFSGEWEERKIGDLINQDYIIGHLDGNHGELYPKANEFTKEGIPYIAANNLINGKVDKINCKFLPKTRADKFKKGISKNGDVLFAHNATVGPTSILETDLDYVILSTTVTYYRCDLSKLNNHYLMNYFMNSRFISQYSRVMGQSTRNQVPLTEQRKLKITLPSLPEQEKIADFLSSVDRKIELLEEEKKNTEEYKKGVMQKIFNQELKFKDENGEEFGEWEEKKLGEIGEVYQPKTISQTELTNEGFLVYGANGIIGKYHSFNHENEQIAVTCRGNTCGTINFTKPKSWITGNAMVINIDKNKNINKKFLYYILLNDNLTYLIAGSGQPQITGDIKNHKIKVSSFLEQEKIADFLSKIDDKIELIDSKLEKTKNYKKGLLQDMFV